MTFDPIETEGLVVEEAHGGFKLLPVTLDSMRPDEVLVEMKYSGICHTDLSAATGGYGMLGYPAVFGHEGAGIVRKVGSNVNDSSLHEGAAVILSFNHCGRCRNCTSSHPACCSSFETLNIVGKRIEDQSVTARLADGRPLMAQFFGQSSFLKVSVVSQNSVTLCPCPEDLALYAALGCGFQTGAGTILNSLKPSVDDSLVIFGAGTVGMACIMAAKYLGLRQIIAVDIVNDKLQLAKELGATHVVNSRQVPAVAQEIRNITDGEGAQFAVECTGVSAVLNNLLDCVSCGGTAAVVGCPRPDFILNIDPVKLLHENKTLKGICQGDSTPKKFILEMMQLHRSGDFPLEKLCTTYEIESFDQAVADVRSGKIIKAILRWR